MHDENCKHIFQTWDAFVRLSQAVPGHLNILTTNMMRLIYLRNFLCLLILDKGIFTERTPATHDERGERRNEKFFVSVFVELINFWH